MPVTLPSLARLNTRVSAPELPGSLPNRWAAAIREAKPVGWDEEDIAHETEAWQREASGAIRSAKPS